MCGPLTLSPSISSVVSSQRKDWHGDVALGLGLGLGGVLHTYACNAGLSGMRFNEGGIALGLGLGVWVWRYQPSDGTEHGHIVHNFKASPDLTLTLPNQPTIRVRVRVRVGVRVSVTLPNQRTRSVHP